MTHLAGKKFSKSHTTSVKAATKLGKFLARQESAAKIILGEIRPIAVGPRRLKIQPIDAGLRLTVRDTSAVQTVYAYTKDASGLASKIEAFWAEYF